MLRRKLVALALVVGCTSAELASMNTASALKGATQKPRKIDVEALRKDLESGDDARIVPALERVAEAGTQARPLAPQVLSLIHI